jgi:hypothetical protein
MSEFDKGTGWFCIVIWGYGWDGYGYGYGVLLFSHGVWGVLRLILLDGRTWQCGGLKRMCL